MLKAISFGMMLMGCSSQASLHSDPVSRTSVATRVSNPTDAESESSNPDSIISNSQPTVSSTEGTPSAETQASGIKIEAEEISRPVLINGTYLSCVVQLEPSEGLLESSVACRLDDGKGNRVDPLSFGAKARYTLTPDLKIGFESQLTNLVFPERTFDVTAIFKGTSNADISDGMRNSLLQVDLINLASNQLIATQKSPIRDLETKAPIAAWSAVAVGSTTIFLDLATGLKWTSTGQVTYSMFGGIDFCNNLTIVDKDNWLLPNLGELLIARNHGIGTTVNGMQALNVKGSATYWTTTILEESMSLEILAADLTPSISAPFSTRNTIQMPILCYEG